MDQGVNQDGYVYTWPYVEHDTSATSIDCSKDGRTRQEFAADCDINVILQHYEDTGAWRSFNRVEGQYLDLSEGVPDLASALRVLDQATAAFMTLPARTRAEFDNDPVRFVAFCEDGENLEKLREWGLAKPAPVEEKPIRVEMVNPAPPETPPTKP